jgi:23S rRNA (adenine2503-C2)-methyltransferase
MQKKDIICYTEEELRQLCREKGYRDFHGSQVFSWIHHKLEESFSDMTDLPTGLRRELENHFSIGFLKQYSRSESRHSGTVKYGLTLADGKRIEAVALSDANERNSFCISSQVGCAIGCTFCATGKIGLERNLYAEEMVAQVLVLARDRGKPQSILFMGMGEPLLNYDQVARAITLFISSGIGPRKITISTCGILKPIYTLADSGLNVRLAVSLGSAIEEKRRRLIPAARQLTLARLGKGLVYYRRKTKRRVSLEYTLISGVNDGPLDAQALVKFARQTRCHVNLIRYNPVAGEKLAAPDITSVRDFRQILESNGIAVSERYRRGQDITAACGQLVAGYR